MGLLAFTTFSYAGRFEIKIAPIFVANRSLRCAFFSPSFVSVVLAVKNEDFDLDIVTNQGVFKVGPSQKTPERSFSLTLFFETSQA